MDIDALLSLLALIAGFAVTVPVGRAVIRELKALKAGQEIREEGPKWHEKKAGTPTMGGIMFIIGSGLAVLVLTIVRGVLDSVALVQLYVFLLALCFGSIGFLDDYRKVRRHQNEGLTARQKFLLQLVAALVFLLLMYWGRHLKSAIYIPFANMSVPVPLPLYLFFAAFVVVGTVNAVNLTDGIDGLAASVTLVVMVFFAVVSLMWNIGGLPLFPAAMVGALAGFLVYNHHPAKVFMGDTGSLFLGGAVAGLAFATDMPVILIPIGIIYVCETLSVILQVGYFKLTHGKRLFKMSPLHHHFELCGWSEKKLVLVFSAVTAIGCLVAFIGVFWRNY